MLYYLFLKFPTLFFFLGKPLFPVFSSSELKSRIKDFINISSTSKNEKDISGCHYIVKGSFIKKGP